MYDALLARDFEAAKLAIDSNADGLDFLELHPVHKVPPLMLLVAQAVQYTGISSSWRHTVSFNRNGVKEQRPAVAALAHMMIDAGADPMQLAPFECQFVMRASMEITKLDEEGVPIEDDDGDVEVKTIVIDTSCAGRSALSVCLAVERQMRICEEREIVGNWPMAIQDGDELM